MIYVVMRSIGEYSDRYETPIRAFSSEKAAQAFVDAAMEQHRVAMTTHADPPRPYGAVSQWSIGQGEQNPILLRHNEACRAAQERRVAVCLLDEAGGWAGDSYDLSVGSVPLDDEPEATVEHQREAP